MSDKSAIHLNEKGEVSAYVGPDGVELARVKILRAALKMWARSRIIPSRGITISVMLAHASKISGKKYKRSAVGACAAIDDLTTWISIMESALPQVRQG